MKTRHALLISAAVFAGLVAIAEFADSQVPQVTVVGAVTAGDCAGFSSTLQLKDTGAACGATGTITLGGPTLGVNGTINLNGSASGQAQMTTTSAGTLLFSTNVGQLIRFFTGSGNDAFDISSNGGSTVNFLSVVPSNTGIGPTLQANGTDTNIPILFGSKGTGGYQFFSNAQLDFQINGSTTAVNFLTVSPANTGASPILGIGGTDTNTNLVLQGKGTGQVAVVGVTNPGNFGVFNAAFSAGANIVTGTTGGHLGITQFGGGTPTLTAGCNGAGSSVTGNDITGTVVGQTAAATTCTLTFGTAFGAAPKCVTTGNSSAITSTVSATGTLVVTFASTANYVWTYFCPGV